MTAIVGPDNFVQLTSFSFSAKLEKNARRTDLRQERVRLQLRGAGGEKRCEALQCDVVM
jgi:hypothetical protein